MSTSRRKSDSEDIDTKPRIFDILGKVVVVVYDYDDSSFVLSSVQHEKLLLLFL